MPSVNASGDIFALSADARFEGPVTGRAGAGTRLSVELAAEVCHGLNLEASARAVADASASIAFLLAGQVGGSAFASAGLAAKAQLAPNLFDKFGLTADVAAYAQAAAAARLSIGLDFNLIEVMARGKLDGLPLELFLAFLKEVDIEAGIWARAAVAAMAEAYAEISGTLKSDDEAGFSIAAGAGAGLGVGAGFDFFVGCDFTNLRRFYGTSVDLITRELIRQARAHTPDALAPAVEIAELLLPVVLHTALDLGQMSALGTLQPPEKMVEPFLASVGQSLERYVYDKLETIGSQLVTGLVDEIGTLIDRDGLTPAQRDAAKSLIDDAIDELTALSHDELGLDDLVALGGKLIDMAAVIAPEAVDPWKQAIALAWTAMACGVAARDVTGSASSSASSSFVGFGGVTASGVARELPDAPTLVLAAYSTVLRREVTSVGFDTAIDFVVESGVAPLLKMYLPPVADVLDAMETAFGLSPGDIVEAALKLSIGENVTTLSAYQKLRDFASDAIDGEISTELIPRLKAALGAQAGSYSTEVAAPSLMALKSFVFDRLDALIGGIGAGDSNPFQQTLSAGLSTLVYRILARNVLFLDTLLFEFVLDSLEDAFDELADEVRGDPAHVLVRAMAALLPLSQRNLPPIGSSSIEAVQAFVAELALAGRDAFGSQVWTASRRSRFKDIKQGILIGFEGTLPYDRSNDLLDFFKDLILCDYVPDEDALTAGAGFLGEIIAAEMGAVLPRVVDAFTALLLELTRAVVDQIEANVRAFIKAAADAVRLAQHVIEYWARRLQRAIDDLEQAARDLADALHSIAGKLRQSSVRRQVKDALRALGAARVEEGVRLLDGNPHNPNPAEDLAVATAVGAFHIAFGLAGPAIDAAIDVLAAVAGELGDVIEGAVDAADALEALIDKIVGDAIAAVNHALSSLGLALPREIDADDIADAIIDALPTDLILGWLTAAFAAKAQEATARAAKTEAARGRAAAIAAKRAKERRLADLTPDRAATIGIESPLPLTRTMAEDWIYGAEVPLRLRITGAKASYFESGNQRRVRLGVNSRPVHFEASQWEKQRDGSFRWSGLLRGDRDGLVPGLNVLEVSIANGQGEIVRSTVAFLVDPRAGPSGGSLTIDGTASQFGASLGGRPLSEEWVALCWHGAKPFDLVGWRLQNQNASAKYVFKDLVTKPDRVVRLVTGGDPKAVADGVVHWGRAVSPWSKKIEVVRLIDPHRVLRAEYLPGPATIRKSVEKPGRGQGGAG
ncbi:hypothetical protein [Hypericibacter sp.]|uniref:hypothetical protein n=1 Tax=Hypericibacter sp. TaxID=2705401 RepID=UPI003D6D8ED6